MRPRRWPYALMLAGWLLAAMPVPAAAQPSPEEVDREVQAIARMVNCLVCPGQSVWESASPWAEARRREIRAMVEAGMSRREILAALEARYGPEILLAPPPRGLGTLAWAVPVLALASGLALAWRWARRRTTRAGSRLQKAAGT